MSQKAMNWRSYPNMEISIMECDPLLSLPTEEYDEEGSVVGPIAPEEFDSIKERLTGKKFLRAVIICHAENPKRRAFETAAFDPECQPEVEAVQHNLAYVIAESIRLYYWGKANNQ